MNQAQKDAIRTQIANLEDNMYRFQMQERAIPGSKTGNGEAFTDVITDHKRLIAELKEGL